MPYPDHLSENPQDCSISEHTRQNRTMWCYESKHFEQKHSWCNNFIIHYLRRKKKLFSYYLFLASQTRLVALFFAL